MGVRGGELGWGRRELASLRCPRPLAPPPNPRFVGGLTAYVESKPEVDTQDSLRKIKEAQERTTRERWRLLGRFYDLWYQTSPDHEHFSASLAPDLIELFGDSTAPRAPGNVYAVADRFVCRRDQVSRRVRGVHWCGRAVTVCLTLS